MRVLDPSGAGRVLALLLGFSCFGLSQTAVAQDLVAIEKKEVRAIQPIAKRSTPSVRSLKSMGVPEPSSHDEEWLKRCLRGEEPVRAKGLFQAEKCQGSFGTCSGYSGVEILESAYNRYYESTDDSGVPPPLRRSEPRPARLNPMLVEPLYLEALRRNLLNPEPGEFGNRAHVSLNSGGSFFDGVHLRRLLPEMISFLKHPSRSEKELQQQSKEIQMLNENSVAPLLKDAVLEIPSNSVTNQAKAQWELAQLRKRIRDIALRAVNAQMNRAPEDYLSPEVEKRAMSLDQAQLDELLKTQAYQIRDPSVEGGFRFVRNAKTQIRDAMYNTYEFMLGKKNTIDSSEFDAQALASPAPKSTPLERAFLQQLNHVEHYFRNPLGAEPCVGKEIQANLLINACIGIPSAVSGLFDSLSLGNHSMTVVGFVPPDRYALKNSHGASEVSFLQAKDLCEIYAIDSIRLKAADEASLFKVRAILPAMGGAYGRIQENTSVTKVSPSGAPTQHNTNHRK